MSADLNVMMRTQARAGLQVQLDKAVTDGETDAARKIADEIAKLDVSTAPKAPPYGDVEIRAQLDKLEWFGVDPKKSGRAIALGRDMDPKKFATAELFTAALIKAVDEEFKPAVAPPEGETDEEREAREEEEREAAKAAAADKKPRRTDGPSEGDANQRAAARRASAGPWTKLADAPADVQKDVNRTADKFAPKTKEGREGFVIRALETHYRQHQQRAGKK